VGRVKILDTPISWPLLRSSTACDSIIPGNTRVWFVERGRLAQTSGEIFRRFGLTLPMARTPSTCRPFDAPLGEDNQGNESSSARSVMNEAQFPRAELVTIGVTLPPPRHDQLRAGRGPLGRRRRTRQRTVTNSSDPDSAPSARLRGMRFKSAESFLSREKLVILEGARDGICQWHGASS
jgi:hypothetical protein